MDIVATWRELGKTLLGDPELTPLQVAESSGLDIELLRRLWASLGFPPVPDHVAAFTQSDLTMVLTIRELLERDVTDVETLTRMTRVVGQSMARVAEAEVSAAWERGMFDPLPGERGLDPQDVSVLEGFIAYVWRRHLLAAAYRYVSLTGAVPEGRERVIGFADLKGFTALSRKLSDIELSTVVDRFEALVYEIVPAHGGRVVKMIGDEVMYSADEPDDAAEIALRLVERVESDETLPDLRIGMAWGPVVPFDGDLFGQTVNLASRLVDRARRGTILLSEELATRIKAKGTFRIRRLPRLPLKGIGFVKAYALRDRRSD